MILAFDELYLDVDHGKTRDVEALLSSREIGLTSIRFSGVALYPAFGKSPCTTPR
jgi:hypothetical protein